MTVEWVAKKYLTVNFFDDAITQEYFGYLNKNAQLSLRNALHSMIKRTSTEVKAIVMQKLQKHSSKISFALDGWTSITSTCFYGITGTLSYF